MDKKTRTIIIVGCIVTFLVIPAVTALILSRLYQKPQDQTQQAKTNPTQNSPTLPKRSNDELTSAITNKNPDLVSDGKPTFTLVNASNPLPGWYVVTIRDLSDVDGTNPAKLLIQDTGNNETGLNVLLGPGTAFPAEVTDPLGIPGPVVKELNT